MKDKSKPIRERIKDYFSNNSQKNNEYQFDSGEETEIIDKIR